MLSIIICSKNLNFATALKNNISKTIGNEFIYELLIENNTYKNDSIAKIYNNAFKRAKFDYVLFIHEDIFFKTEGWGNQLIKILNDKTIGVVGLAGTLYLPKLMGTWPNLKKLTRENIWNNETHFYSNPNKKQYEEAVVLDGVFLACRKETFSKLSFSEYLTGFHCYDLDFCLNVRNKLRLKCVVTYNININHFSSGKLNEDWVEQQFIFFRYQSHNLPSKVESIIVTHEDEQQIKKQKTNEFFQIFCFQYSGGKRIWLLLFFIKYSYYLISSTNIKLMIRYLLFGKIKMVK